MEKYSDSIYSCQPSLIDKAHELINKIKDVDLRIELRNKIEKATITPTVYDSEEVDSISQEIENEFIMFSSGDYESTSVRATRLILGTDFNELLRIKPNGKCFKCGSAYNLDEYKIINKYRICLSCKPEYDRVRILKWQKLNPTKKSAYDRNYRKTDSYRKYMREYMNKKRNSLSNKPK